MDRARLTICILTAAYNEQENIPFFYEAVKKATNNLPYHFNICFVNDGSTDNTLEVIKSISQKDNTVKYISFSKNFGQQTALKAGIDSIDSDAIIMMDCDLQHAPELIPELIAIWQKENVNMVNTIREEDDELSWFKRKSSKWFYKILNSVSELKLEAGQADFRLIDKEVINTLKKYKERKIFLRGIISCIGYKQTTFRYNAQKKIGWQKQIYFF